MEPDDIIKVTRFRQHWLFGERVQDEKIQKDNKIPSRGWFPRRCAVELIQPEQPFSSGEDGENIETEFSHRQLTRTTTTTRTTLNGGGKTQNGHRKKNN